MSDLQLLIFLLMLVVVGVVMGMLLSRPGGELWAMAMFAIVGMALIVIVVVTSKKKRNGNARR